MDEVKYSFQHPADFQELYNLYEELGWNKLKLSKEDLEKMCRQSWFLVYAYYKDKLIGTGRIISDGVITGLICGVGVHPHYQSQGIGKSIIELLVEKCKEEGIIAQLMCNDSLEKYYEKFGFERFSIGMSINTRDINN